MSWGRWPILQIALDYTSLDEAVRIAERISEINDIWLEAGTPLIKSEGIKAVKRLRELFPDKFIVADLKIADAGKVESELAAKAGADMVTVLGTSATETIQEVVETCREFGIKVMVDLMDLPDPLEHAEKFTQLGADALVYHVGYGKQRSGLRAVNFMEPIKELAARLKIPLAVAGGIRIGEAGELVRAGCKIIIVGKAVTKTEKPELATRLLLEEIKSASKKL
ncbi:MAG: orotidine 5'-phosphate decarboxylase [Thaumarchaeota archaeon]|nr:orotidine 5'-phosphate decarboxylase [Nitrososphaerota archaeon]